MTPLIGGYMALFGTLVCTILTAHATWLATSCPYSKDHTVSVPCSPNCMRICQLKKFKESTLFLRGGMKMDDEEEDEESSDSTPVDVPGTNQTYTTLMQKFGISEDYLQKLKGEDRTTKQLRSKFVTGARIPAWRRALEEAERNGTHRSWIPIPATALLYEQPSGPWRPGDDPLDPAFRSGGPEADGHSEAAGGGYAPFNFRQRDAVGGIQSKFPQLWGEEEEMDGDRDEDWITPERPEDRGPRWDGTMDADHPDPHPSRAAVQG